MLVDIGLLQRYTNDAAAVTQVQRGIEFMGDGYTAGMNLVLDFVKIKDKQG